MSQPVLFAIAVSALLFQATPPKVGTIPRHTAEPVVIRDGSLKIDIYAMDKKPVKIEQSDTIVTNAAATNGSSFLVPTGVKVIQSGPTGKTVGELQTSSGIAHGVLAVKRYVYNVERLDNGKFVFFEKLIFQLQVLTPTSSIWRIFQEAQKPLSVGCKPPVPLSGVWADHYQSTCEYGPSSLRLRIGSVTVEAEKGTFTINMGTGCSESRIEPSSHSNHPIAFDHVACPGLQLDPAAVYPKVQVKGVDTITAIDVSLAK